MKLSVILLLACSIQQALFADLHNVTTTKPPTSDKTSTPKVTAIKVGDDPLSVHQLTYHGPDGKVTCSISIADDTDPLQLSDDNFGYPRYIVEDEFKRNKIATQMFEKYLMKPIKQHGDTVNLHLENMSSMSHINQLPQTQSKVRNPFANNNDNVLAHKNDIFSQFHQPVQQQQQQQNPVTAFGGENQQGFGAHPNSFPAQNQGFQGFDFSSPIANTKNKANIVTNGFHFPTGGIPLFRKKRMASTGFQTSFSGLKTPGSLCQSQTFVLRRYLGHGGKCFLVQPEVQNIKFVKCKKEKCSSCNDFSGVTQCAPETMQMWAWSYCDSLPTGQKVIYDKIKIPTHCACKTFAC